VIKSERRHQKKGGKTEKEEKAMKEQEKPSKPDNKSGRAEKEEKGAMAPEKAQDAARASRHPASKPVPQTPVRLRTVDRQQILPAMPLDQIIESDHPARSVWQFVEDLDLSVLYNRIRSRQGCAGRPASDPRVLVALWLYAILYGVVSARRLEELSIHHSAFRWLRGGVPLNHHMLSDFLIEHVEFLDQLFTHSVTVLQEEGLVDLDRVGQDGMRVRASAGAASFRRKATLEKLLHDAKDEVQRLKDAEKAAKQAEEKQPEVTAEQEVAAENVDGSSEAKKPSKAQLAAQKRAAEERLGRIEQALARMPEMEAKKKPDEKTEARVSTTDAEATVMKMADGGFRPAYNIEYSTDTASQVIVGVDVVTVGSDQGQLPPMLDQIEERFDKRPKEALVDGGFAKHEDIEAVQAGDGERAGCKVYAPVPKPKKEGVDRYAPHVGDGDQVAEWRQRMATDEAKEIYKERAATAELVNAQARNRGMIRLLIRGLQKIKAFALWFATAHNVARGFALLPKYAHSGLSLLPDTLFS
jgi:transposase